MISVLLAHSLQLVGTDWIERIQRAWSSMRSFSVLFWPRLNFHCWHFSLCYGLLGLAQLCMMFLLRLSVSMKLVWIEFFPFRLQLGRDARFFLWNFSFQDVRIIRLTNGIWCDNPIWHHSLYMVFDTDSYIERTFNSSGHTPLSRSILHLFYVRAIWIDTI